MTNTFSPEWKAVQALLYLLLFSLPGFAQNDSIIVSKTKWEILKIAPGVKLQQQWFDHSLFGTNQNISIVKVKLHGKIDVNVEAEPKRLKPTSEFGEQHRAIAGINGTFFDMKNGGSVDYIRLNGIRLNPTRLNANSNRSFHQKAAVVTNHNKVEIAVWDGTPDWEERLAGDDVMVTGPLLIDKGERVPLDTTSFFTARHPRTAIALRGKKLLLITVDGRNENAAGMNLYELASFLKWLKVDKAVNLDGGGSTTMWVNGFPEKGVINHPSDNKKMMQTSAYKPGMDLDNLAADEKKWDHGGERPVANVILISRKH